MGTDPRKLLSLHPQVKIMLGSLCSQPSRRWRARRCGMLPPPLTTQGLKPSRPLPGDLLCCRRDGGARRAVEAMLIQIY